MTATIKTGLELLRQPFPKELIGKLPKPTKQQTEELKANYKIGIRCSICGVWHHPNVVHVDYVGHAALTDRLLDCDPNWNWEPLSYLPDGRPLTDNNGGMWIKLTICGVTRLGYGDAQGKTGGDSIKECIGDAIRNAAMRFGAALDLWSKQDLHFDEQEPEPEAKKEVKKTLPPYPNEKMKTNKLDWSNLINSGKQTPEAIINKLSLVAILTDEQIKEIKSLKGDKNADSN